MSKIVRASLYARTILNLKPGQAAARVMRKIGRPTELRGGYKPSPDSGNASLKNVAVLPELDFDSVFLSRFDVNELMGNRVCLLHHAEDVDWSSSWRERLATPLWEYNLHYCEYLLPLAKAYIDTMDFAYLDKGKAIISSWIEACPESLGGAGWDSYTIAMRCVNWLAFCCECGLEESDPGFVSVMSASLLEQYLHLAQHLEKDLLANHYFEDLKALAILACYFSDSETLDILMPLLGAQIKEQVLPDGMHFELSPMYHKIVFEDMMRVAATLKVFGYKSASDIDFRLQDMADCLYSLERNTDRTPLFNDSGDNVAKSRDALLECALRRFGVEPRFKTLLPDAGYCIFERETEYGIVKTIFDVGGPGPSYAMGHVQCDALSFECFIDGKPWVVNCGTYAYQDDDRLSYKATLSHSTVTFAGTEQHECWAPFRVARYGACKLVEQRDSYAVGEFTAIDGRRLRRTLRIGASGVHIRDVAESKSDKLVGALHFANKEHSLIGSKRYCVAYAPEFGMRIDCPSLVYSGEGDIEITVSYPGQRRKDR